MWESLFAVETAPQITNRENIESLAELKAWQKALKELMEARFEQINNRFGQMCFSAFRLFHVAHKNCDGKSFGESGHLYMLLGAKTVTVPD